MSRIIGNPVGLGIRLSQFGPKVVKHVVDVMRDESGIIQELARNNAPVDKGDLEGAIKIDEDRGGINRRVRLLVYVDPDHPDGDRDDSRVGDYMMLMHEGLAPYGSGAYQLGIKSRAKASAGMDVGGKFFERAYLEREPKIASRVHRMIQNAIRSGKL